MEKWKSTVLQSKLFQGFTKIELEKFLSKAHGNLESFEKGQIVANEESPCTHIGIVISGVIDIQKTYPSGKFITINHLEKGEMFGEVIVFSDKKTFPATLITQSKSQVYFLKKEELMQLNQAYPLLMENFMKILSQKILILNQRVKSLSYHTLRQRIIDYILEIYKKQNAMMFQKVFHQ